tara:strand:+ start:1487 stop:3508 length:2022 start_codon:yes stop_codon:yes gene_type:complete
MPRRYTKKSDYWDRFATNDETKGNLEDLLRETRSLDGEEVTPASSGEPYYAKASYSRNVGQISENAGTTSRVNRITSAPKPNKYANIAEAGLPYAYKDSYVTPRESILLCQKAYANIAIFRNAIDVMAEFSNSDLYLDGGSEKSRSFVEKWMEKIQIWKVKDQYFREYYRSGNVFMYKLDGKFSSEDFIKLNQIYGAEGKSAPLRKIPIRYIFLNPYDFVADRALTFNAKYGIYKKILSEYDIERLKDPQTEYDKEVFNALPEEAKEKIRQNEFMMNGVMISLDPYRLIFSFYKKQDYEPFAIPFGFPVLDDINWKIELKKVDQAITRTIENVILLVTMGNTPDKGGINPNNLKAMQSLFQNESIGRALIADYTTKAEFIIPDLNKVLGAAKYQIVNEDIKEGLQNIIVGKENYSSTQVKAQIFLERLKEARNTFLNDFMQPQIKEVCKAMGFRNYPTAKFVEIDIKDEVQLQRVATRLIEMGIITPEQGMIALKQGVYPDPHQLPAAQEKFVKEREKGYYTPLSVAQPIMDEEAPAAPPPKRTPGNSNGRPAGSNTETDKLIAAEEPHSRKGIQGVVYKVESLMAYAETALKKQYKRKRLSKEHKQMLESLSESVVMSREIDEWEATTEACIKDFNNIESLEVMPEVLEISEKHEVVAYPAAILYHSKKIKL